MQYQSFLKTLRHCEYLITGEKEASGKQGFAMHKAENPWGS